MVLYLTICPLDAKLKTLVCFSHTLVASIARRPRQTFSTIYAFNGVDGIPSLGRNHTSGVLYGTTADRAASFTCGAAYQISRAG